MSANFGIFCEMCEPMADKSDAEHAEEIKSLREQLDRSQAFNVEAVKLKLEAQEKLAVAVEWLQCLAAGSIHPAFVTNHAQDALEKIESVGPLKSHETK